MRYMMIMKANDESEADIMPDADGVAEMGKFNEELAKHGVLLDAAGLKASKYGARIRFTSGSGTATVVDGPFTETKELIAGYWILEVSSREEALEWARRVPGPEGAQYELELRELFGDEEFEERMKAERG